MAIIAAVGILNRGVETALERDARVLLGGDVELEQANAPMPAAELARIVPPGGALSAQVRANTLASAADGRTVSVNLKAVDDAYPLVGEVVLDPPHAAGRGAGRRRRRGRAGAPGPAGRRASATRCGSARPSPDPAVLVREPDRIGGLFGRSARA